MMKTHKKRKVASLGRRESGSATKLRKKRQDRESECEEVNSEHQPQELGGSENVVVFVS